MLTDLLQNLIRIPSENNGITGYENDVQVYFFNWLLSHGVQAKLIYPEMAKWFENMPGRLREHEMCNRPLVVASLKGKRPGKKLLLIAHADTVPVGNPDDWQDSPFSGVLRDGMIYGRGASDDKWGMSLMGTLITDLKQNNCEFPGELVIASVPDEESGGGNGTLSIFASGTTADEAIYLDGGSNQTIWNVSLGGGLCRIYGADRQRIRNVILEVKENIRNRLEKHPHFGKDFFKIIERQFYGISEKDGWLTFFLDTLPGDSEAELIQKFEAKLPDCQFKWMTRFLKPAAVSDDSQLVQNLQSAFQKMTGKKLPAVGGVQSDQGLVCHYAGIPCILFGCGRRGLPGSAHLANECVEISKFQEVYETIRYYVLNG